MLINLKGTVQDIVWRAMDKGAKKGDIIRAVRAAVHSYTPPVNIQATVKHEK